jgi:predicted alpha/beta superfamily hydrolase
VGEEAYLAKKKLKREGTEEQQSEFNRKYMVQPSLPTKEMREEMAAENKEAETAHTNRSQWYEEKRLEDTRDASLDLMLQKNAVEADILTEKLNQSRLDLQRLEAEYNESMMSLTPAERIKYGF